MKPFPSAATTAPVPPGRPGRDDDAEHGGPADAVLAERIRAGDGAAFEILFHRYFRPLHAYAVTYVRARDLAEDLTADVFVRLWEGRDRLVPHASLRGYLYAAVRNEALAHLRRQRMIQRAHAAAVEDGRSPGAAGAPPAADRVLQQRELADAVEEALRRLPERGREALVLHRQHGLSYAEVAAAMGISPRTVEVHIRRAFRSLRTHLAEYLLLMIVVGGSG